MLKWLLQCLWFFQKISLQNLFRDQKKRHTDSTVDLFRSLIKFFYDKVKVFYDKEQCNVCEKDRKVFYDKEFAKRWSLFKFNEFV